MKNTSQSSVPFAEPFPNVSAAVSALTQPQLDRLLTIARRRIERLTQSPPVQRLLAQSEPNDFVHDAIMLVLLGELESGKGRRTHPRHLASHRSFFNFLQGILHSRIASHLKKMLSEGEHHPVENSHLTSARSVVQDVQLNELKAAMSTRLRAFAGDNAALRSTLLLLELDGPVTDGQASRKQLHKMRRIGREVIKEMAAGDDVKDLFIA